MHIQRTRVKVCGVTCAEDARTAVRLGADAVGLNFHPGSPRFLEETTARSILEVLAPYVEAVAVFANRSATEALPLVARLGRITTIQLHGTLSHLEDMEPVNLYPYRIVPAFAIRDEASLDEIDQYMERARVRGCVPSAVLVDGYGPGLTGGTGQRAPWELLARWQHKSWAEEVPLILAGGLTPDNVAEAVQIVRPYAVDVASGIETVPTAPNVVRRKDPEKMRRFIGAVQHIQGPGGLF